MRRITLCYGGVLCCTVMVCSANTQNMFEVDEQYSLLNITQKSLALTTVHITISRRLRCPLENALCRIVFFFYLGSN